MCQITDSWLGCNLLTSMEEIKSVLSDYQHIFGDLDFSSSLEEAEDELKVREFIDAEHKGGFWFTQDAE